VAVGLVAAFFIPEMPLRGASDVEPILATE
jgi:hypothetical protein